VITLTRAIPECIRGGLRRCAIQIDVYFTYLTTAAAITTLSSNLCHNLTSPLTKLISLRLLNVGDSKLL